MAITPSKQHSDKEPSKREDLAHEPENASKVGEQHQRLNQGGERARTRDEDEQQQ